MPDAIKSIPLRVNCILIKEIALLRHQLFLPSETFIAEQARSMRLFRPLLIGRELAGRPAFGLECRVPETASPAKRWSYVLFRNPRLMQELLADRESALLHAHFGVEAVYGLNVARRLRIPLVTTFHGFDATLHTSQLLRSLKPSWVNYACGRPKLAKEGALFVCVSKFIQEKVLALGFPLERTVVNYIGVDVDAFECNEEEPHRPIVLHVARLVEKKGTQYLLRAFSSIAKRHPETSIVIIGNGPLKDELSKLSSSLGISSQVRWLGTVSHTEVKRYFKVASVFCLPSCVAKNGDSEGLSTVVVEAAASGVPVISTRHAGIPEAVIEGKTGYLVAERDVDQLAGALEHMLDSYDLRRRMAKEALAMVRDRFDVKRQTQALERFYQRLI